MLRETNFGLREEIKAYWSARASTFDLSPGHEIFSEEERQAWHALIRRHLGAGEGLRALDLASGTGVVSHLMDDLGWRVTGFDWSEAMLEQARAKAAARGRNIRFVMGDAENTMEPDETYDAVVTRHLVWTLVDPMACFREWYRVLKPGGRILIIDGDFVQTGFMERLVKRLGSLLGGRNGQPAPMNPEMASLHGSILSRVYFSGGAPAQAVAGLLAQAGMEQIAIDTDLRRIHRAQASEFGFIQSIQRGLQHRYAVTGVKPG